MRQRRKLPGHTEEFQSSLVSHFFNKGCRLIGKEWNECTLPLPSTPGLQLLLLHRNALYHCLRINNTTDVNENNEKTAHHGKLVSIEVTIFLLPSISLAKVAPQWQPPDGNGLPPGWVLTVPITYLIYINLRLQKQLLLQAFSSTVSQRNI